MSGRVRAVTRRRAQWASSLALVLSAIAIAIAAATGVWRSPQPKPAPLTLTIHTTGFATAGSFAEAKASCVAELPRLRSWTGHEVHLLAAYPTDSYYAWTWTENDPRVDRPSDRLSAKVCLYRGHFTEGPSSPPKATRRSFPPKMLPLFAQVQEPNGQDLGSMLAAWPRPALHLVSIHPYVGHPVVHWAPW